ncbi:hypothetical protein ACIOD2_00950 [Amycolatopsis sp. NPDC088138]|uniref:hypothetical protein n=1 Tax=Amycolatopsis sp. NPDC088138 TaxID=3363938 RepID=UPI0037FE0456
MPVVSAGRIAGYRRYQGDSIVLFGLVHVQTAVSVHALRNGIFPLCAKVDGLGTVYA